MMVDDPNNPIQHAIHWLQQGKTNEAEANHLLGVLAHHMDGKSCARNFEKLLLRCDAASER